VVGPGETCARRPPAHAAEMRDGFVCPRGSQHASSRRLAAQQHPCPLPPPFPARRPAGQRRLLLLLGGAAREAGGC
jgi:hypothetical protein